MASKQPYLIPGDVLTKDLLAPDTGTVLVPAGTVLNHDAIERIRSAGLERATLRLVVAARNALESGLNLKAFGGKPAGLASTMVQARARRIMSTTAGLRALLLLTVFTSAGMAALMDSPALYGVTGLAFTILSIVTMSTGSTAQTYTRHLKDLRTIERNARLKQQNLEHRAQEGEIAAIKELIPEQVLGPEHCLSLEAGKGWLVAHVLLPDARLLLSPAGLGFNVPAAPKGITPVAADEIPEVEEVSAGESEALRDPLSDPAEEGPEGSEGVAPDGGIGGEGPSPDAASTDAPSAGSPSSPPAVPGAATSGAATSGSAPASTAAPRVHDVGGEVLDTGGQSLRVASGPAIEAIYNHAAEVISAIMSASPMTKHVAIAIHDACVRKPRPKQPYWGCVANFRIGRDQYLEGQREGELSLFLVRHRNVHIQFERDHPFHEIRPVPLKRPTDVVLDPEESAPKAAFQDMIGDDGFVSDAIA